MFKSVEQKSLVAALRDQIWGLIHSGQLNPGDKLPPEKQLIHQLHVSRPTLREAIHLLIGEGLLEVRPGRGIYVREPSSASAIQTEMLSLLLMSEELFEIQEVRAILEPEIAARVSEHASDEEFDQIEALLDRMGQRIREGESIFDLAWEFHQRLARACGNAAMAKIVDILYEMIKAGEERLYDSHFDPFQELETHRDLLHLIRQRDPAKARAAMKAHISSVDIQLRDAIQSEEQEGLTEGPVLG